MPLYESDFSKFSFEEAFSYDDLVIVERTIYNGSRLQLPSYKIYGFAKPAVTDEISFLKFKKSYIDSHFSVKYFFSYVEKSTDLTITVFIYERNSKVCTPEVSFNPRSLKLTFSVDPYACAIFPERDSFEISLKGKNMSVIDLVNLLITFDVLDKKSIKHCLNKKNTTDNLLLQWFLKDDTAARDQLKKDYPRLLI